MTVLFVFDGIGIGGIERVGIDYVNLLSERGYSVYVVNLCPDRNELSKEINEKCKIINFCFPRKLVHYRYQKLFEKGILGVLAYIPVFVMLVAYAFLHRGWFKIFWSKIKSVDCAIAMSGHYNDLYFVAHNFVLSKRKIAWLHGAQFEYKMISEGYFSLYKRIRNLICLSEMCDIVCDGFNKKNSINKIKIYNPIRITERPLSNKLISNLKNEYRDYVLMVGRMNKDKDQGTAIKAIKLVNEKYKKKHLVLVGDGPTRDTLEIMADDLGVSEYVHFIGNRNDVQNYYSAAKVYVHSSPMEGLPTVLLEAMSYNVPIAATDSIPGVREILGNNEYGLISPIGDAESLAENIILLYEDTELRERLVDAGKMRIRDFIPEASISKLEKFMNDLEG